MIPYEIDPSLHPVQTDTETLGDGFSPPAAADGQSPESDADEASLEAALAAKSQF